MGLVQERDGPLVEPRKGNPDNRRTQREGLPPVRDRDGTLLVTVRVSRSLHYGGPHQSQLFPFSTTHLWDRRREGGPCYGPEVRERPRGRSHSWSTDTVTGSEVTERREGTKCRGETPVEGLFPKRERLNRVPDESPPRLKLSEHKQTVVTLE